MSLEELERNETFATKHAAGDAVGEDEFQIVIADDHGSETSLDVGVTVRGEPNEAPDCGGYKVQVQANSIDYDLAAWCQDSDSVQPQRTILTPPARGTVTTIWAGIRYMPEPGYVGVGAPDGRNSNIAAVVLVAPIGPRVISASSTATYVNRSGRGPIRNAAVSWNDGREPRLKPSGSKADIPG